MRFNQKWVAARYNPQDKSLYETFPANVPGNVQLDYANSHDFGDVQYADNVKKFKAIEDFWWVYRTELDYNINPDESLWFVAEGVDYIFDIALDGEVIFSYEGMFTPIELNITEKAKKGSVLDVIIHPHPKREGAPESRDQADQSCKPAVHYEWDWNPRLLVSGLWRDAYIETRTEGFIYSCELFYTLNDDLTEAEVKFVTECKEEVTYTVTDMDGNVVYNGVNPGFKLNNINLWWSHDQGVPYLYSWTAKSSSHERTGKIGFRTVRLVMNEGAESEPAGFPKSRYPAPITVELNGRRIFIQGSNWVNPELFPGTVTKERYVELLGFAKEANMNFLRVWAGAGLNKPEFYDLCDELGIMFWQEFPLACNNYIATKKYLSVLEKEATSIIKQLRRHPALIIWCGGNELFNQWSGMDDQSLALRLLNKLCYEEDFGKPYIATSPLTGMAHGGYYFKSTQDEKLDTFQVFNNAHNTAYAEFGVPAMAPASQLEKVIPKSELFPPRPTDSWVAHHGFGSWEADSWVFPDTLKFYFGESENLEEMTERSGFLQRVGYKSIFEESRRQWPYCSMAVNWCFNEPWITAGNNSVISYPNVKKQGYYGIKEALRPVIASARAERFDWQADSIFSAELWLLNSSNETASKEITATIIINGKEYEQISWKSGEVDPRTNKMGPTLNFMIPYCEEDTIMTLKLKTEDGIGDSSYSFKVYASKIKSTEKILNH